ncbi:Calx-beta domain-containing protein [Actinoplanes siamensis]
MPIALWGSTRIRQVLASVAVSAAALVPATFVASPASAAAIPNLTISPAGVWEGGTASFTVTYTGTTSSGAVTFDTAGSAENSNLTATKGTDFTGTPSVASYTFPGTAAGGTNSITVTVDTTADASAESDETFQLTATAGSNTSTGTGTIWEPDPNNEITLAGPSAAVPETAVGGNQPTVTITATSTNPQDHDVVIPVRTANAVLDLDNTPGPDTPNFTTAWATPSGNANRDYTALPADAVITIPANQTSGSTTVTLWDDTSDENDTQYFNVEQDPDRATLGGAVVSAQSAVRIGIKDDDALPVATIADATSVVEGNRLVFPLNLTNPSEKGVPLDVTAAGDTVGGTAGAAKVDPTDDGTDTDVILTTAQAHTTIPKYASTSNLSLTTTTNPTGPNAFEGPEGVKVTIAEPVSGATSKLGAKTTATGIVTDVGQMKTVYYGVTSGPTNNTDRAFIEGSNGPVERNIFVKFDTPAPQAAVLNYTFADGTAKNGEDFTATGGSVTLPKDATEVKIPITINGDRTAEPNEDFNLVVTSPSGVVDEAFLGEQRFTITDDDAAPTWTTEDIKVQEGNTGTTLARVPIRLSAAAPADLTFTVASVADAGAEDNTTTYGSNDYDTPTATTVTVKAGETVGYYDVPVNGDDIYERDEAFTVTFTPPISGLTPSPATTRTQSRVTIGNDDAMPKMQFSQGTVAEGGSIPITGTIVGTSQYPYDLGVTVGGGATNPATAGADYQLPDNLANWTLHVRPGEYGDLAGSPFFITNPPVISVLNDTIDEPTETLDMTVNETSSILTGFATSATTVKIADDPLDLPPAATIQAEVTADEVDGTATVPVSMTFTGDATSTVQTVTIPYYTADGTAKVGQDYKLAKGTLSIPPGTMNAVIKVPLINDPNVEPDEFFSVRLGTPQPLGASVINGDSTVTIKSDDTTVPVAPTLTLTGPSRGAGSVTASGKATAGTTVTLYGAALPTTAKTGMKAVATTTATSSGTYKFSPRAISTGWAFYVKTSAGSTSVKTVRLTQSPSLSVSTSKGKLAVTVIGNPKASGQTVTIQRKSGNSWVKVGSGKTTSTGFKGSWSFRSGTKLTVRALVSGNTSTGINAGYSASKSITIK